MINNNYYKAYCFVLECSSLTLTEKMIICYIMSFAGGYKGSYANIANKLKLNKSTVFRAKKKLVDKMILFESDILKYISLEYFNEQKAAENINEIFETVYQKIKR